MQRLDFFRQTDRRLSLITKLSLSINVNEKTRVLSRRPNTCLSRLSNCHNLNTTVCKNIFASELKRLVTNVNTLERDTCFQHVK